MNPIRWVPSLYMVQGLQFFVVMLIAGLMFKSFGVSNDEIGHWTALLGLAWAFKPLWSPLVELVASKKRVVVATQFVSVAGLLAMALVLRLPAWFPLSVALLFVLAYTSATHDIACDGLYMASLSTKAQAQYAGWQGAFFNTARFLTNGGLLILAGWLERRNGVASAWSTIFAMLAVTQALLAAWNAKVLPPAISPTPARADLARQFAEVVLDFLKKPGIVESFVFIVLFRFAEGQVQTISPLFLRDPLDKGGLGLSTDQVGAIYGTAGTAAFLIGSVLGGYFTARLGLRRAMPALLVAMMVPNAVFFGLASSLPTDPWVITAAVALEMGGYGFGFVGMILYIMQVVAPGRFNTAHYALGTGMMQLGFMISKGISGDIQLQLGYARFFGWTLLAGLPVLLLWFWVRRRVPADAAPAAA